MDADTKMAGRTRLVLTIHSLAHLHLASIFTVMTVCRLCVLTVASSNGTVTLLTSTRQEIIGVVVMRFCTLHSSICYGAVNVT